MEKLQQFNFENQPIKSLVRSDGSIWFVASDVCKVLGLGNITEALRRLYDNEKNSFRISEQTSKGGNPNKILISESGLYKLIMRSTKPQAIQFQDWVTQEVLPKIRKDGGYINPNAIDPSKPIESFTYIVENMYRACKGLEGELEKANFQISQMRPQVQMLESFFNGVEDDISFNTMAKLCKFVTDNNKPVGGLLLKNKCIEEGFISKKDRLPRQEFINKGYFKIIYTKVFNRNEGLIVAPTVFITPKGQRFLYERLQDCYDRIA